MYVWRTYQLSDFLLFSPDTYDRLFELHNAALWPWQVAAVMAGLAMLVVAGQPLAMLFAGAAWLLTAWLWFYQSYSTINWAAEYVAWGFAMRESGLEAQGVASFGQANDGTLYVVSMADGVFRVDKG